MIRGELTTLDYHMPSVGDVLFDLCREHPMPDGSVILAGIVRDWRQRPVQGASVTARWTDFTSAQLDRLSSTEGGGLAGLDLGRGEGVQVTTDGAGFYHVCGVPADTRITVQAVHGEQESETYDVLAEEYQVGLLQAIRIER